VEKEMNHNKTSWYSRLWALEVIRRRVPYAYWLFYDAVIICALIWGGWTRILAFVCVGIAVFFDVVEFIIKGSESKFLRRLFEGTGAPTK
jgi:hypothetical protein